MIVFSGNNITIDGTSHQLAYPIAQAFVLNGRVIVLFDPDSYTARSGQFHNLVALLPNGEIAWTAELPTTTTGDRYWKIASEQPLVAYSVHSYECDIDAVTGQITGRRFYK